MYGAVGVRWVGLGGGSVTRSRRVKAYMEVGVVWCGICFGAHDDIASIQLFSKIIFSDFINYGTYLIFSIFQNSEISEFFRILKFSEISEF